VGLAIAAALIVLVASGAAVNRLGSGRSGRGSSDLAGPALQGSVPSSGGTGSGPAPAVSGDLSASAPVPPPVPASGAARIRAARSTPRAPSGTPTLAGSPASPSTSDQPATAGGSDGTAAGSGRSPDGGDAPPSPQGTAEPSAVAASAAVGEGSGGAVVGLGVGDEPEADVTLGTTPLLGDAPPSGGTGIGIGGSLLHPPPTIPILPG
jgi:hypothetical protein